MANVTIATISVPGWQGNSSGVSLRIYVNSSFTDAGGVLHQATAPGNLGTASLGTFFATFPCTASSGSLVIPAIPLASTTDSPDNPDATYSAVLWDEASGKQIQPFGTFPSFSISPVTSTTWPAIFAAEATL